MAYTLPTIPIITPPGPLVAQVVQNPTPMVPPNVGVDPVFQGLAWVAGILLAVLGIAKPFMGLIRQYKTDMTDNARDNADTATFDRLTKQIDKLSADMERVTAERNVWFEEATTLKSRVEKLEGFERSMLRMKDKLDEKDGIIAELRDAISARDARIMELMQELIKTNSRLHDLEIRVARDEGHSVFTKEESEMSSAISLATTGGI